MSNGTHNVGFTPGIRSKVASLGMVIAFTVFLAGSAKAQTLTLYSFNGGTDGRSPDGGVVLDSAGNLYGTTAQGGNLACNLGCGVVFKVDSAGSETVLYSFAGSGASDGAYPSASLERDAQGNLYGTTESGGAFGYGTVFKVDMAGRETVLHSFIGTGGDGEYPCGGVVQDAQGILYGTTEAGGASGYGTVFKLDKTGKEMVLYSFTGMNGDGELPFSGVVRDSQGDLYGTTEAGGTSNYGTVFKLNTAGKETVLYSFVGGVGDGGFPLNSLVRDAHGNLYGTTAQGGVGIDGGNGVVFELSAAGNEKVLSQFPLSGMAGTHPNGLVRDALGNLFGTTVYQGAFGWGTVFKISATGKPTVLYNFTGTNTDGGDPHAGLVIDGQGNLYGTTSAGAVGYGTVFQANTVITNWTRRFPHPRSLISIGLGNSLHWCLDLPSGGWVDATQTAELTTTCAGLCLGLSAAVSGNTIVLGAPYTNNIASKTGAAFVYVRPSAGWTNATQTAELTTSDGKAGADAGDGVAIDGDTVVVGAPFQSGEGNTYAYVKPASGWVDTTETAELSTTDLAAGSGLSVGISGDTIVSGAFAYNNFQGSAYVYVKPTSGWVSTSAYTARLTSMDGRQEDSFGAAVAISGRGIMAGAAYALGQTGRAYLFVEPAAGWATTALPTARFNGQHLGDFFGWSVAIDGKTVVVGAKNVAVGSVKLAGAAYVFGN